MEGQKSTHEIIDGCSASCKYIRYVFVDFWKFPKMISFVCNYGLKSEYELIKLTAFPENNEAMQSKNQ